MCHTEYSVMYKSIISTSFSKPSNYSDTVMLRGSAQATMGLGQCNSLGEYCVPHTASSVFLTLLIFFLSIDLGQYDVFGSLRNTVREDKLSVPPR